MAQLKKILTKEFTAEDLKLISEKVAEECGEEWVTVERIAQHNTEHQVGDLSLFRRIIRFLFISHPNMGFLCFLLIPPIILLPAALKLPGMGAVILFFGLFIGFFVGSFIFPGLVTSCRICGSIKKCKRIFTYSIDHQDHTEKRYSNGTQYKYLVRVETVFCVYECQTCKSRKIEILKQEKEKQL